MFADWIVALVLGVIATPIAIASYLSAREPRPIRPAAAHSRRPHRVPASLAAHVPQHRHYRRRLAA